MYGASKFFGSSSRSARSRWRRRCTGEIGVDLDRVGVDGHERFDRREALGVVEDAVTKFTASSRR